MFIPLQVIAFATLPADLRTDGTALFSLVRNVGAPIGVSVTSFLLAQNTQVMHAQIAERVTPFNRMLQTGGAYLFWNSAARARPWPRSTTRSPGTISRHMDDFRRCCSWRAAGVFVVDGQPRTTPASSDHVAVVD